MPDLHCMIDLETMDVKPSSAVLTIGACMFNPRGKDVEESIEDKFEIRISLESNMQLGRTVSASTVCWWLEQSEAARRDLVHGDQVPFGLGIFNFRKWITDRQVQATRVWAKSPDFDCKIMESSMAMANEIWPFRFYEYRCVRTITELAYPEGDQPPIGVGTAHNAVDDAVRQALMVQHCFHVLNC